MTLTGRFRRGVLDLFMQNRDAQDRRKALPAQLYHSLKSGQTLRNFDQAIRASYGFDDEAVRKADEVIQLVLHQTIDMFSLADYGIVIDPAPIQCVRYTPVSQLSHLLAMLHSQYAFVTDFGQLIGICTRPRIAMAVADVAKRKSQRKPESDAEQRGRFQHLSFRMPEGVHDETNVEQLSAAPLPRRSSHPNSLAKHRKKSESTESRRPTVTEIARRFDEESSEISDAARSQSQAKEETRKDIHEAQEDTTAYTDDQPIHTSQSSQRKKGRFVVTSVSALPPHESVV